MSQDRREAYEPPAVQRVRFAPGEVAAGACKQDMVAGRCKKPGAYILKNAGS